MAFLQCYSICRHTDYWHWQGLGFPNPGALIKPDFQVSKMKNLGFWVYAVTVEKAKTASTC